DYLAPGWWREGPLKLQFRLGTGERLVRWLAAKIERIDGDKIELRGAEIQGDTDPREFRTTLSFDQFDRWSRDDISAEGLEEGRFLEIGLYVKDDEESADRRPITIIRVHRDHPWRTGASGNQDTARYLVPA